MNNLSLYPHTLMDFHGTWTGGYWGMGTHMTQNQRSSRGHLRSLTPNGQDIHNWSHYPHTLMDFHGSWTKEYWGMGTYVTPTISWMQ